MTLLLITFSSRVCNFYIQRIVTRSAGEAPKNCWSFQLATMTSVPSLIDRSGRGGDLKHPKKEAL